MKTFTEQVKEKNRDIFVKGFIWGGVFVACVVWYGDIMKYLGF